MKGENMRLHTYIRDVPDFPKKGILFRDIAPLLAEPDAFAFAISLFAQRWSGKGLTKIAAFDSRGFLFGPALALALKLPFIMLRKKGKLPGKTASVSYGLEYGTDALEIQEGFVSEGDSVLLVDDVLATGGTAAAGAKLIEQFGGKVVGLSVVIDLMDLGGRATFGREVHALVSYGKCVRMADLIIELDDDIVLIERLTYPFGLAFAGGHIDAGETAQEAAIREGMEETGLLVDDAEHFGQATGKWLEPRYEEVHTTVYAGKARGEIRDEVGHTKVVRLTRKEAMKLPNERFAFPFHGEILKAYLTLK